MHMTLCNDITRQCEWRYSISSGVVIPFRYNQKCVSSFCFSSRSTLVVEPLHGMLYSAYLNWWLRKLWCLSPYLNTSRSSFLVMCRSITLKQQGHRRCWCMTIYMSHYSSWPSLQGAQTLESQHSSFQRRMVSWSTNLYKLAIPLHWSCQ